MGTVRRLAAVAATLTATLTLGGCFIFGGSDEAAEPPAELVDFEPTLKVRRVLSVDLGKGSEELRLGLAPVSDGARVYAASRNGRVWAIDPETGRRVWRTDLDLSLSAGPGLGFERLAVASSDGELVTLALADGEVLWRRRIDAEVLAPPAFDATTVVARTVDGRLIALDARSGEPRWELEQNVPSLSLRGTAAPVIAGDLVVSGFDNGRLLAVELDEGDIVWDQMIAPPSGRSDVERLVDIDGAVAAVGRDVYVSSFHGRVASIALESGQPLWARSLSSHLPPGVDWSNVYVVTEEDEVVALSRSTGAEEWRQDALRRRELTKPVPFGSSVVVGDFEGWLHWLDARTGAMQVRVRSGNTPISGNPMVQGERLYVQTEAGRLLAYEIVPSRRRPDIADRRDED